MVVRSGDCVEARSNRRPEAEGAREQRLPVRMELAQLSRIGDEADRVPSRVAWESESRWEADLRAVRRRVECTGRVGPDGRASDMRPTVKLVRRGCSGP